MSDEDVILIMAQLLGVVAMLVCISIQLSAIIKKDEIIDRCSTVQ